MSDWRKPVCAVCCGIVAITFIVVFSCSFASLEINEYGLDYSSISKTVGKTPYTNGLYFLGIGHSFLKFPKNVQTLEFSNKGSSDNPALKSRTSDGLEVTLEISFQYKLRADKLYELYHEYGMEYRNLFENIAIDSITGQALNYTAYKFFKDRQEIGTDMQQALNEVFQEQTYSSISFFQLKTIDLPDKFETAIQETEVKRQDINKAKAEKKKNKVEIETNITNAKYQKNITVNLAKGEAEAIIKNNEAHVWGFNATQLAQAEGYSSLKQDLGFDGNADLLKYLKTKVVKEYKGKDLVVGFDPSAQ